MVLFHSNRFMVLLPALLALSAPHLTFGGLGKRKIAASLENKYIPWKDLVRRLSEEAKLIKGSTKAFAKQCDPGFDKPRKERTEPIFDAKSGLCLDSYVCAFKDCLPGANHSLPVGENLFALFSSTPEDVEKWKDPSNPDYDLPASVLFPKTAGDIVAAVEFANDNRLELSVKSSGHNYSGQSSKKDTLLLNTKRFQKYAATGIVECDASASSEIKSDLSNQPCVLALARNKEAYIRVATGESFLDTYKAVHDFNEAQEKYKYHMVGGYAPTVTPMGWTFQGGMSGSMMGRRHGYGVDQVLMIEAVLPTGEFVRFGPTSFEDVEGFRVPKTTAVSGVCNQNPFDDEESWVWGPCAKDINFDDLWYAFRGGGGGTYGIVTSLFLQLHEHQPLEAVYWVAGKAFENCSFPIEDLKIADDALSLAYAEFRLDFMLEPSEVGVSDEDSASCGTPVGTLQLWCFGEGSAAKYISAWKQRLEREKTNLMAKGIPESSIDAAGKCLDNKAIKYKDAFLKKQFVVDPSSVFTSSQDFDYEPTIEASSNPHSLQLIPFERYKNDKKRFVSAYSQYDLAAFYFAVGGIGTNKAHDQETALSFRYRDAAFYTPLGFHILYDDLLNGYNGQNHMLPYTYGPLKQDYGEFEVVKPCPLDKLTVAEADELCYSHQESVWGPERLARLEKIKATVDPNHILNCYKCVGYKKDSIAEFKPW